MHAIYGLVAADFTTVFLEPDVAGGLLRTSTRPTSNPLLLLFGASAWG
jgi:hypothetical protein